MTASVTALEAKTRLGKLLDRVSRGEEIVVTRHDRPVARIIPVDGGNLRRVRAAVVGLREIRRAVAARRPRSPVLTDAQIKAFIDEGRR